MKNVIVSAIALATLAGAAQAQIAQWDLLNTPGSQISQPGIGSANVTALPITRGAGLTASGASNSFSSAGWESAVAGAASTEFISFGFSVAPGFAVNLSELFIGTRSSGTGPGNLGLFSSVDGFSSNLFTFNQASTPSGTGFLNSQINLASLSNLTGNVEFRIIELGNTQASGSGATASTGTFRLTAFFSGGSFDRNLQFTGTVIPTPGALALAGVAGLVVARRRRA